MPSLEGKIRYAVVGGGWIAQGAFMPSVKQTDNSIMTAIVTGDPEKARQLGHHYGLDGYSYEQYGEVLKSGRIDAVYVATPTFRHREFAEPALEAGIHVLLEKPMEASLEDARAIQAAAEASSAKLMVAYRLHCEPGTVDLVERLRAGVIGEPRVFSAAFTQFTKETNHRVRNGYWAGPMPDMGTYPINAVRNLFQAEPIAVSASSTRSDRDVDCDDTISAILTFAGGRQASFTVSFSASGINRFELLGTKGRASTEPAFGFGPGTEITTRIETEDKTETIDPGEVDQFAGQTQYFSECILEDRDPEPDGEEGVLDMIVLDAIEKALQTGETQKLEPRSRSRRIGPDQKRALPLADVPDFVNIEVPVAG